MPLRYQKATRHALIETQGGHMHQTPNAGRAARIGKRRRRNVMHFLVRFSATLTQDANAIHDDINLRKQRLPDIGGQKLFEPHSAAFAAMRLHRKATRGTLGIPTTDNDFVLTSKHRSDGVAPDKACAAEHENAHQASRFSTVVRSGPRATMRANTL